MPKTPACVRIRPVHELVALTFLGEPCSLLNSSKPLIVEKDPQLPPRTING